MVILKDLKRISEFEWEIPRHIAKICVCRFVCLLPKDAGRCHE